MPEAGQRRPYPGLRPFESDEADLFFGRERQVDALLERLSRSHFVAVVGESGAGKSSLVRAGLLPALEAGFVVEAGSDWRVAVMRPGGAPLAALADALRGPNVLTDAGGSPRQEVAVAELRRGPLGLAQLVADAHLAPSCNLLLVVDQFEELFRYCREPAQKDQANILVELLLQASAQRHVPISVVLTMRSDFVGDCARFRGLPERLNDNQFLTPRLTREEVADAIRGPARVCGGVVDAALVDELCNAVGDNQDQLPLLQHLLMRTWEEAAKESNPPRLTPERSKALGGLYSALSNHAQEIYESLPGDAGRGIARAMFKSLTDPFSQRRDLRRDASVLDVAVVAGVKASEVIAVAEEFRADGRHMLMPPVTVRLDPDSRLDISHESLIRQWSMLGDLAAEEAVNAREFARLREEASRDRKDRELLTGRNLARALEWKRQAQPTLGWAERYAPAGSLEATLAFIDESEKQEAEREAHERQMLRREAEAKRSKVYNRILTAVMLLLVVAAAWAIRSQLQLREHEQADHNEKEAELQKDKAVAAANLRHEQDNSKELQQLTKTAQAREATATAGQRAADSLLQLPHDPLQALSLAAEGLDKASDDPGAIQALRNAIAVYVPNRQLPFPVAKHKNYVPGSNKQTFLWSALSSGSVSSSGNLAVVPFANTATVFSTVSGNVIRILDTSKTTTEQTAIVGTAILSPDGRRAVTTGGDGKARVWDISTGRIEGKPLPHKAAINGAVFSRDGRLLVTLSDDHHASVWTVGSDQKCELPEKTNDEFLSASFSPDHTFVVTIGHPPGSQSWHAFLWRLSPTGCAEDPEVKDASLDEIFHDPIVAATFSPAGPYLGFVTATGKVKLLRRTTDGWHLESDFDAGPEYVPNDDEPQPPALAWSSDGRYLAAAGADNVVRVGQPGEGNVVALRGHSGRITSVSFHPQDDTLLLSTSTDHTARVWKLDVDHSTVLESLVLRGHVDAIHSGVFSATGDAVITASDDTTVRLWKPALSLREISRPEGGSVGAASFSSDGTRVLVADRTGIVAFATDTLKSTATPVRNWKELRAAGRPTSFAFTRALSDVIKVAGLPPLARKPFSYGGYLGSSRGSGEIFSVSPNGRYLVQDDGEGESIKRWDLDAPARGLFQLPALGLQVSAPIKRPREAGYRALGVSNDGARIAWYSLEKNGVLITGRGQDRVHYTIQAQRNVDSMRFSGDGRKLAVTLEDYSIQVLDADSPLPPTEMRGHTKDIAAINFSADDRLLASVSDDGTSRIWDVASGREVVMTHVPDVRIDALSFSPNGLSLLFVSRSRLFLWQCRACGDVDHLRQVAGR